MSDLTRRAVTPGSALERVLAHLERGADRLPEAYPQDPATGRPTDRTLCPDCFRLYDRECRTCGGDRHRDGSRGRVCPDCGGQRIVPIAIRGTRTRDLTPCGSCTDPKETDGGRLIFDRGIPGYIYQRARELSRIAEWQRDNPGLVRPVKHALHFDAAAPEYRANCPYPVADPYDADLDLDAADVPF